MGKTMQKHNLVTIYVKEKYKPLWEKFNSLIEKDADFIARRYKTNSGLASIAILQLIYDYILTKEPNFKLKDGV